MAAAHVTPPQTPSGEPVGVLDGGDESGLPESEYVLRLYVTGMTARSHMAISATRAICEEFLAGRYALDVIDISRHPEVTQREQIIASPTLIKYLPLPLRRLVGDLSQRDRVLAGLGLYEPS
jgi:circadian clock protein KaiB